MSEWEIVRRAVAETLAYLGEDDPAWDPETLAEWADRVRRSTQDAACCPFCAEVVCDDDCPMRHVRG